MTSSFTKATREQLKLRMAIDGPSGAGKSVTALRCARALVDHYRPRPDGRASVAVMDAESGSARKYVGEVFDDLPIDFDVKELWSFSPSQYTAAIEEAGRLGFEVLVIDGLSHAWEGLDGALELVDRNGGNRFTAWKDVTPMHRRMVEAILHSPCHVICTMRSKTEYVLEKDERGKEVPRKVGVAPIQRPGMEYEFDLYCSLDVSHMLTVAKTRCRAVDGLVVAKPGPAFMAPVVAWLGVGVVAAPRAVAGRITDGQLESVAELLAPSGLSPEHVRRELTKRYGCLELHQLSADQADDLLAWLRARARSAAERRHDDTPGKNGHAPTLPFAPQTPPPQAPPATLPPTPAPAGRATEAQLRSLAKLRDELAALKGWDAQAKGAQWLKILGRRGVATARDLTPEQADVIVSNLKDVILKEEMTREMCPKEPADAGHKS